MDTSHPATAAARRVWSTGDFHRLGVTQQLVSEILVADLHVHTGERVSTWPAARATARSIRGVTSLAPGPGVAPRRP